jgi:hypothetical protein
MWQRLLSALEYDAYARLGELHNEAVTLLDNFAMRDHHERGMEDQVQTGKDVKAFQELIRESKGRISLTRARRILQAGGAIGDLPTLREATVHIDGMAERIEQCKSELLNILNFKIAIGTACISVISFCLAMLAAVLAFISAGADGWSLIDRMWR